MKSKKTQYRFTPEERIELFELLEHSLAYGTLRQKNGVARAVLASEFQLMHKTAGGLVGFKHIFTRNYIFLFTKPGMCGRVLNEAGTIYIPMENRIHMRGYFGGPGEEVS